MHFRAVILLALCERAFNSQPCLCSNRTQRHSSLRLLQPSSCYAYSDLFHIFLNDHYPGFTCVAYWIGSLSSKHAHPKRIKSLPTTPRHVWLHGEMDSFQRGDYVREKTHLLPLTFPLLAWTLSVFLHWQSDSAVASAIQAQSLTEELGGYLLTVWSSTFCLRKPWSYKVHPEECPQCVFCMGSHLSSL